MLTLYEQTPTAPTLKGTILSTAGSPELPEMTVSAEKQFMTLCFVGWASDHAPSHPKLSRNQQISEMVELTW